MVNCSECGKILRVQYIKLGKCCKCYHGKDSKIMWEERNIEKVREYRRNYYAEARKSTKELKNEIEELKKKLEERELINNEKSQS